MHICVFLYGGVYMLVHVFPEAKCIGCAWSWSYGWLSGTGYGCWESNLDPLEKQNMLLTTEPSFQHTHPYPHLNINCRPRGLNSNLHAHKASSLPTTISPAQLLYFWPVHFSSNRKGTRTGVQGFVTCMKLEPGSCEVRTTAHSLLWEPPQNQDLHLGTFRKPTAS